MSIPYEKSFATHEKAKYWSEKNILKPEQVYLCSGKTFLFNCDICEHEFNMSPINISSRNRWCSYCSNTFLCENDDCMVCYFKSFACSVHCDELADKSLNPRRIFKNSNKKFTFICKKCNHTINMPLNAVSQNVWCKYCTNQDLCGNTECKICFDKSFASSSKLDIWSQNNKENPRNLFKFSHSKYLFTCKDCNHDYSCSLANVIYNKGCSYCKNKILCRNLSCNICFNKTVASCTNMKWSSRNLVSARMVFKQSNKKYIFDCKICNNEYIATPNNVYNNRGCPKCRNKSELNVYNYLKDMFDVKSQVTYEWCKNPKTNRYLPFDLECNNKIIIEIDGLQHFKQIWCWKSPEEQNILDRYKNDCAIKNNKHIIRIFQEDIYYNRNNWDKKLIDVIRELLIIDTPTIKYIGNIYNTCDELTTPH